MKSIFKVKENAFLWDVNFVKNNILMFQNTLDSCKSKEEQIDFLLECKANTSFMSYLYLYYFPGLHGNTVKKMLETYLIDSNNILEYSVIVGKNENEVFYGKLYEYVEREKNEDSYEFLNHYKANAEMIHFLNQLILDENIDLMQKCIDGFTYFPCYAWVKEYFNLAKEKRFLRTNKHFS